MKMKFNLFAFGFLSCFYLHGQDFHFSQFNETPDLVNPALTGVTNIMRASIIYRDQWRSVTVPYTTYGVAAETRFKASNWQVVDPRRSMTFKKSTNRFAAGMSVYNDKAGTGKLGTLQSNVSFSMFFPLTTKSTLGFGLQGSLTQRKIDANSLIYPNQYNGKTYDSQLASGENFGRTNFLYPELGSGVTWAYGQDEKSIAANNEIKALVGFSMYHINQPRQNFISSETPRLYRKYVFHGNVSIGITSSNFAIEPSWLLQFQGPNKEIVAGILFKFYLSDHSKYTGIKKRTSVSFGGYYRNQDALIANLIIDRGLYTLGFCYDINSSTLIPASKSLGGFELSLKFAMANAYLYQKKSKSMH
jgi:type IX secretion system PorP/SprF family membrane protein